MAKYRICPYGIKSWLVQKKVWLFWQDADVDPYYFFSTNVFNSEKEAEEYIDKLINSELQHQVNEDIEAHRKKTIPPREYP